MKRIIVLILFQLLLLPASAVSVFSSASCFQQQLVCILPVMKETKTKTPKQVIAGITWTSFAYNFIVKICLIRTIILK